MISHFFQFRLNLDQLLKPKLIKKEYKSQMEMLKSKKSQLTCSYCSKILKDPIDLPCGDSICLEHLSDKDILKVNRIKCKKCNKEFGVKNNEFKSNEDLKKLVEDQSYFTEEEIAEADQEVQKRLEVREESRTSIEERLSQYRDVLAAAEVEF